MITARTLNSIKYTTRIKISTHLPHPTPGEKEKPMDAAVMRQRGRKSRKGSWSLRSSQLFPKELGTRREGTPTACSRACAKPEKRSETCSRTVRLLVCIGQLSRLVRPGQ
ncbi:hypothetical protein KM043_016714 [Ampulex compressa]|nr:hypothetical protein KM043_016714 [Ampulex compressa]